MSVLVLTEDSASSAFEVIRLICKSALQGLDDGLHTHRIGFEPPNKAARSILTANKWKSKKGPDRRNIVELCRAIASKLSEENGFVFFHVDADQTWTTSGIPENRTKFGEVIEARVTAILSDPSTHREAMPRTAEQVERLLTRMRLVMPYYSIEAWLYQHTLQAQKLCESRCGGAHVDVIQSWRKDRGLLDEIDKPKDTFCLGSSNNVLLAGAGWPSDEVAAAMKSFSSFVDSLYECDGLGDALAQTYKLGTTPL